MLIYLFVAHFWPAMYLNGRSQASVRYDYPKNFLLHVFDAEFHDSVAPVDYSLVYTASAKKGNHSKIVFPCVPRILFGLPFQDEAHESLHHFLCLPFRRNPIFLSMDCLEHQAYPTGLTSWSGMQHIMVKMNHATLLTD